VAKTPEPPLAAPSPQEALSSLLCDVLPPQGAWSDREYLWLTDHTNRLIELADGDVEELPMPTDTHQAVLMRVRERLFREPDVLLLDRSDPRRQDRFWLGPDLVVEVVIPDDPDRDLVEKRADAPESGA
jgi:hypothetical protein